MTYAVSARAAALSGICDTASIQFDNDQTANTDRNYTGGIRLACVTSPPTFVRDLMSHEPDPDVIDYRRFSYSIGQSLFTPDDLSQSQPIEGDHPYAGWLYLGFGLESEIIPKPGRLRHLDNLELQLGVIGPLSGAEQTQRIGHRLLNATDPQGWGNQLDNEPGINLFYSRQWTGAVEVALPSYDGFPALSFDMSPQIGMALGNVHIFGGGGLTIRLGSFLREDHGPPVTRPGLPGSDSFPGQDGFSAYAFGSLEGRAVGRNIFLDGNTFNDSGPRVDKNTFVSEARVGMVLTYDNYRLAFTQTFRGQEFEGQSRHSFGSLALSIGF